MTPLARAFAILTAAVLAASAAAAPSPSSVVILANRNDPDSLRIARHYAEARGVPAGNLLAFPMPEAETVSWPEFVRWVWQPLQDALVSRGWIDAAPSGLFDDVGRRKYAIAGHRIGALVACRGVPLRVAHDAALYRAESPFTDRPEFRTNQGAVDSELSLLAMGSYPINGLVDNPLFGRRRPDPFTLASVVKVSRLDGATADDAEALVDRALEAERRGLIGRCCLDLGGDYPEGDAWLESVAAQASALGFDETADRTRWPLAETARCDETALYFGWHFPDVNGPFVLPGFRFAPGAIAFHIHSFSARTLRSDRQAWCGPLVARGAAATLGNVFEPYLQATHQPQLFLQALSWGWDLVDAAYYALPVLSWQAVVIGDPLYRPFAVSADAQWRNRAALPPELAGYVALRRLRLREGRGEAAQGLAEARAELKLRPNLALAAAVADRLEAAGRRDEAALALESSLPKGPVRPDQWALLREAAARLESCGRPAVAMTAYRSLLDDARVPWYLREPWLVDARRAALAADDGAQAAAWRRELLRLVEGRPAR